MTSLMHDVAEGLGDLPEETWSSLGQLSRALHIADDAGLDATLVAVLAAAVGLIDGAQAAGLNLFEKGKFIPQAVLGSTPPPLDELQKRTGVGPCIDASREQTTIEITDTRHDDRWPDFTALAEEVGVSSMLCVPLWVDQRRVGSLSLYSPTVAAFSPSATQLAGLYATHAALALAQAQRAEQLQRVVASRDLIGQAKGILMATRGWRAQEAFDALVDTSQRLNQKVVDIAEAVATTGQLPAVD
ncbi:GAF and ANTAR domain-containing protein [Mycolicibacterium madagascariense]|uniref:GAF and ANTAR domain-containing protein n=1 Tax=Mycolicibacterium madagascariense TaxID=212765 RepID=UPI0013D490EC|nr:GAF and ANTAR domain-containing protein [Mycolicibacterium madagascariense]MCV7014336.1 GAF and ANTAR domain-containing protein [Mycolicibacterium madagascariense]